MLLVSRGEDVGGKERKVRSLSGERGGLRGWEGWRLLGVFGREDKKQDKMVIKKRIKIGEEISFFL